jgi:transcriptional regulator with GAF, ATPase, and Fis domain
MPNYIFIFFAGIALTTGLSYLWLGLIERNNKANLFFGVFSISAGIYFLLKIVKIEIFDFRLVSAVLMFVLFPWYFAYESKYKRKSILWFITGLAVLYYFTTFFRVRIGLFRLEYAFSYLVYALTILYCFNALKQMYEEKKRAIWPFLLVSLYYALFVSEEVTYNFLGNSLPWRKVLSFTYLDLFPVIIIAMELGILISDHLEKTKLEKSIVFYKNNLNTILEQTNTFVASINMDGNILFANAFFKDFFIQNEVSKNFNSLISKDSLKEFQDIVFNKELDSGNVVAKLISNHNDITIAWSFVKMKKTADSSKFSYIYLFGNNITHLKQTEENLRIANQNLEILKNKLQQENIQLRNESAILNDSNQLIGESPNFNYVINRIEDVAPLDVPVLLEGETGVGKELFANEIHKKSKRNDKPFIKINCAAIPRDLIESELFGFEKGAFTGADKLKRGMFELADKGTLFLDEFGELPFELQPKLLRVLQEGELQRLGAEKTIKINTRIIAATNLNLAQQVEKGRFRSDLYYRINVFPITIPPLRNRKTDIPLLVDAFIKLFNKKYTRQVQEISKALMDDLSNHHWPGNVRQLKNIIERAIISSDGNKLKLAEALPINDDISETKNTSSKKSLETLANCERNHIKHVLEYCNWQISGKNGAAEILNLPSSTLRSKMKKLDITIKR